MWGFLSLANYQCHTHPSQVQVTCNDYRLLTYDIWVYIHIYIYIHIHNTYWICIYIYILVDICFLFKQGLCFSIFLVAFLYLDPWQPMTHSPGRATGAHDRRDRRDRRDRDRRRRRRRRRRHRRRAPCHEEGPAKFQTKGAERARAGTVGTVRTVGRIQGIHKGIH